MFDTAIPIAERPRQRAAATRMQRLLAIARWFNERPDSRFAPLYDVERMSPEELAATPTHRTLFAPFETALRDAGLVAPPMATMGALMEHLELSQRDANKIGCACVHTARYALGSHIGQALTAVAGV